MIIKKEQAQLIDKSFFTVHREVIEKNETQDWVTNDFYQKFEIKWVFQSIKLQHFFGNLLVCK